MLCDLHVMLTVVDWFILMLATSGVQCKSTAEEQSATEFSLTCYTCVNVSDNEVCNQFAIDRPCPPDKTFCHTLHAMGHVGESWLVNKKCADRTECSKATVGCTRTDGQMVCVSCCDESYCNEPVPRNNATATYTNVNNSSSSQSTFSCFLLILLLVLHSWPPDVT